MRIILRPFQILYCVYALATFVALMIPVFIWALIVSSFGRIKGGNLIYAAVKIWADIWFPLIFIYHRNIYLENHDPEASYIFVSNHISYLDSAIIPKTFRHPIRPLGKIE